MKLQILNGRSSDRKSWMRIRVEKVSSTSDKLQKGPCPKMLPAVLKKVAFCYSICVFMRGLFFFNDGLISKQNVIFLAIFRQSPKKVCQMIINLHVGYISLYRIEDN